MNSQAFTTKLKKVYITLLGVIEYNIFYHFKPLPPKKMIINITYWCNSKCIMCNIWKIKPKNELSLTEWTKILKDPIFLNIQELDISGGEPSMHPDFNKLTELFIQSMPRLFKINIITNGFTPKLTINKIEKLAKLCQKHNIQLNVSVSIDGIHAMHEKIRRIPNAFQKSTTTIFELKKLSHKYNLSVTSGHVILRQNIDEIKKTEKWFKKNNLSLNFQIAGFHKTFLRNIDTQNKVGYQSSQHQKLLKLLDSLSKPKSLIDFKSYYWKDLKSMYQDGKSRTTPCPFLKDQFILDSFGDIYICLSTKPVDNVRKHKTVSQIYYNPKFIKLRKKMPHTSCKNCNSGCNVTDAISKDLKKYIWFRLTKKLSNKL